MRFEQLRQRVERAESRVSAASDRAQSGRLALFDAWRAGWTPGRIVVAGLLAGFLVGRGQPLAHIGGVRWLQMAGTVSSMLATLRAAAEAAATPADADAAQAGAGPLAAPDTIAAAAASPASSPVHAPAPAEAATELSER